MEVVKDGQCSVRASLSATALREMEQKKREVLWSCAFWQQWSLQLWCWHSWVQDTVVKCMTLEERWFGVLDWSRQRVLVSNVCGIIMAHCAPHHFVIKICWIAREPEMCHGVSTWRHEAAGFLCSPFWAILARSTCTMRSSPTFSGSPSMSARCVAGTN